MNSYSTYESKQSFYFNPLVILSVAVGAFFVLMSIHANAAIGDQKPFTQAEILAAYKTDPRYFEITSVEVKEITPPSYLLREDADCDSSTVPPLERDGLRPLTDGITLDQIINIGQKIWTIVEKNKPVVNLKIQKAEVLPLGAKDWAELECWQVPESKVFRVSYKNGFGMTAVNIALRVNYTYGGRVNGLGRYLSQVTVLPAELDVIWGFKLDGEVRVATPTNAGTKESPVAGVQMDVNWVITTPLKYSESTESFYVQGDGLFKHL